MRADTSASTPDAGSIGKAVGGTSASSDARGAVEVLVVVVVLSDVTVSVVRDGESRTGKGQDGELGSDGRHLYGAVTMEVIGKSSRFFVMGRRVKMCSC